ncbi:MAG TPA: hypothetical protein VKO84_02040 [Gaiellaceae bacterium]|nr:hypothetical protein [Gaiellaceae bacterium]
MRQPTNMSTGVRSVEWVRAQPGGSWLVNRMEHAYYSWNAPHKGGPQLTQLRSVGLGHVRAATSAKQHVKAKPWPPNIKPVFARPLPGEGIWKPAGRRSTAAHRRR